METIASSTGAVEEGKKSMTGPKKLALTFPTLTLPPRNAAEAFLKGSDGATPSPMTFVSSLFADQDPYAGEYKSFSQLLAGAIASPTSSNLLGDGLMTPTSFPLPSGNNMPSAGGGAGSDAGLPPRSNSAKFKSMMPPRLPIPRSPYLTIPAGLSPTTLLDSPVFLPDAGFAGVGLFNNFKDGNYGQDCSPTFIFKPHPQLPNSPLASMGPYGVSHQQALAQVQAQANSQLTSGTSGAGTSAFEPTSTASSTAVTTSTNPKIPSQPAGVLEPAGETSREPSEKSLSSSHTLVPAHPLPHVVERPSEDGFNWRKYGQKQVKGSEYPRSYYKCTHPNCPAKRQVECSPEGEITEIMYKGGHNHAKPEGNRRRAKNGNSVVHNSEGAHHDSVVQDSMAVSKMNHDKALGDFSSSFVHSHGGPPGTPELSFTSPSNEDDENGEASTVGDDGEDEYHSKRRRIESEQENFSRESFRANREPRVVVQTVSEKDILDDGYRWRKYGQKVVKGHHYPRNYYKCTSSGCTVRKTVERSSSDAKSVMTTYEGKHNHSVPPARGSMREKEEAAIVFAASHPALPTHIGSEGSSYVF